MELRIERVKIPLPFPLRWVNGYVLDEPDGAMTLIDPGLHTDQARQAWENWFRDQGRDLSQVKQIVLTHHHPDHYGLAGWLQQRTGAPVLLSSKGRDQALELWGPGQPMNDRLMALFLAHGYPADMRGDMLAHMESFVEQVSPQPAVTAIDPGSEIVMGGRRWTTAEMSGHAFGHLVFYEPLSKSMIVGDHVLPQITPNVGYLPGVDDDPLRSFLAALRDVGAYDVDTAYPGHRDPFPGLAERAEAILLHHEERLQRIEDRLREAGGPGMTAYEVCVHLFGTRLSVHQMRFALSETIAHLIYLERENRCLRFEAADVVRYRV